MQRELEHIRESLKHATRLANKDIGVNGKVGFVEEKKRNTGIDKESLVKSFASFRNGPEIFYLIAKYLQKGKIRLNIPDTLIYLPSFAYPVYLNTRSDGLVEMDSSKVSVQRFFLREEVIVPGHPRFIHIAMNQRIKLCFTTEEAQKIFEECPHFSHRLHRWISGSQNFASKIRVHWKVLKPPQAFIISNRVPMLPIASKKIRSKSTLPSLPNLPNLPNYSNSKDILMHKNLQDLSKYTNIGEGPSFETKKFLVQLSGTLSLNIIQSSRYMPELQTSFNSIVSIINSVYFNNPNRLQELLLDFIKSANNTWVLISCKGHKIKGDQVVNSIKRVESDPNLNISHIRRPSALHFESVTEESLKSDETFDSMEEENEEIERTAKRIEYLASEMGKSHVDIVETLNNQNYIDLKQGDSIGRIPHMMIGLLPHKLEHPISYFIERAKEPPVKPAKHKDRGQNLLWIGSEKLSPATSTKIAAKCLSDVAKVYNKHRNEAKMGRIGLTQKKILKNVFDTECDRIQKAVEETFLNKTTSFHHFFENKSERDIMFKVKKMLEITNCPSEYVAKKKIQMMHYGLGINDCQFEDFLKELEKTLKLRVILKEEEIQVLMNRFRSFKHDIVSE